MNRNWLSVLMVLSVFVFFVACGGNETSTSSDTENEQVEGNSTTESPATAETDNEIPAVTETDTQACGPDVYPCGPYGVRDNDIAANLEFVGYADKEYLCKEHKSEQLDTNQLVKVAFKNWYASNGCAKKKLLWVNVVAGWCSPCKQETKNMASQYLNGTMPGEVGILQIIFENDSHLPANADFLKKWITAYKVPFPVTADPSFKMGAYFSKEATPYNMLIDLSNMKIVYGEAGYDSAAINQKIKEYNAK